jgi:hypothetical protein
MPPGVPVEPNLSRRDLRGIVAAIAGFEFRIASVSLLGWPSNLLAIGRRRQDH